MDLKLNGKTALVTGATAGIGLEIAKSLAAEGVEVTIPGRSTDKLTAAASEIQAATGRNVRTVVADLSTAEGAAVVTKNVTDVDILVNNLGIYAVVPFVDITDEEWNRYFEINVLGGIRLSRFYLPKMKERNWGRIIFISSESGLMTPGVMAHYGMTKTAQLAVSRGLANETQGTSVTVNAVLPGPTRSEASEGFLRSISTRPDAPLADVEAEFFQTHRSMSLLRRLIEPEEVASLVTYLASPLASATNGTAVRVDGGVVPTIA